MIRLYSGTPGSGKSLHNAQDIIIRSQFGEPVIGNFVCTLDKYKKANYTYCPNDKLNPQFLMEYSRQHFKGRRPGAKDEGAILLVIDECQLLFNSRDWQKSNRNEWLEFFTQHRKFGYDITLIAQFDRMIDRQIRSLIEYECIHRKMSNFGFGGKVLSLLFGGNVFVSVQMWYPLKERIGSEMIRATKKLWSIYDSYALFGTDGASAGAGGPGSPPPGPDAAGDLSGSTKDSSGGQKQKHKPGLRFLSQFFKSKKSKTSGKFEKVHKVQETPDSK